METTNETTTPKSSDLPFDAVINTLRDQSRIWARYGLTVGKLALETHARAMSSLATTLGAVAESMTSPKHDDTEEA